MIEENFRTTGSKTRFASSQTRSKHGSEPATDPQRATNRAARGAVALTIAALSLAACTGETAEPDTARPSPSAKTIDGDRAAAATAATTILSTWARPDLPYRRWWADLKPLLTEQAQVHYAYTDPAVIPGLRITGKPVEDPGPYDPYVTTYYLKTTHGRFGVDLARSPSGGPWRAYSIIFPDGQSQRQ